MRLFQIVFTTWQFCLKRLIVDQPSNRISCQFSIFDAILLLHSGRDESRNCDQVVSEYHWWWQFHVLFMNWWLLARESVHRHMAISSMQISKAKRAYLGIIGWFVVEGLGSSQRERVWVHWENVKMLLDFWRMCSLLSTFCVLYIIVSLCNRPTFISYAQTDCSRHHSVSPSPDMNVFKLGDSSYYRYDFHTFHLTHYLSKL